MRSKTFCKRFSTGVMLFVSGERMQGAEHPASRFTPVEQKP